MVFDTLTPKTSQILASGVCALERALWCRWAAAARCAQCVACRAVSRIWSGHAGGTKGAATCASGREEKNMLTEHKS